MGDPKKDVFLDDSGKPHMAVFTFLEESFTISKNGQGKYVINGGVPIEAYGEALQNRAMEAAKKHNI